MATTQKTWISVLVLVGVLGATAGLCTVVGLVGAWMLLRNPVDVAVPVLSTAEAKAPGVPLNLPSGLTLYVPDGWNGVPVDATRAVLSTPDGNSLIVAVLDNARGGDIRAELTQPFDAGNSVVLTPLSTPIAWGSGFSNDYSVSGTLQPARGIILARNLEDGRSLALVGITPTANLEALRTAMQSIFEHVQVSQSALSSSQADTWSGYLRGRYLVKFYSGSNYSEKHEIWLCSNGNYAYQMDGGGFSMNGTSGAFGNALQGAWTASGSTGGSGTLELRSTTGTVQSFTVRMGNDGVYLNGDRWMRGDNTRCP